MTARTAARPTGVLMMAYGGPRSLDEVEAYLLDVRGGRPTPSALVEEVRERYRHIGGRSPLLEITRAQARAVEDTLNAGEGGPFRAYVGMRHWHPYIEDAVRGMAADGVSKAVALCMAPHYSRMSVGAYFEKLDQARRGLDPALDILGVESWNDHPLLWRAIAEKLEEALGQFPEDRRRRAAVLFTAHSLPARILDEGDPYPEELKVTVEGVAGLLGLKRWRFAYQSQSETGKPWLGPDVATALVELADDGHREIVAAPIGFVADHVEVLYDIDIEARQTAQALGLDLVRMESLNTSSTFIAALAEIVRTRLLA